MAGQASHPDVFAREWKHCLSVVIEFSVHPSDRVMTCRANRRSKPCLHVRRVGSRVVFIHMAAAAGGRRIGEIAAGMALGALQVGVRVGEREKLSMIEIRVAPARRRVARGASRRGEPGLRVRRIRRAVVLLNMAGSAVCRRAGEHAVDMALIARYGVVLRNQREFRGHVVVKRRVEPARRVVARRAHVGRETRLRVRRVVCAVEILRVAAVAIRRCARKLSAHVAGRTFQSSVHAR